MTFNKTMPTPKITIQELTLTLAAPDCNPILLTPQHVQIAFTNGINITAQPNSIAFTESFKPAETHSAPTLKIPNIACNYIQTQPHLNYQAITLALRTFITFPEAPDEAAHNTITNLFAPAPWQTLGTASFVSRTPVSYRLTRLS